MEGKGLEPLKICVYSIQNENYPWEMSPFVLFCSHYIIMSDYIEVWKSP